MPVIIIVVCVFYVVDVVDVTVVVWCSAGKCLLLCVIDVVFVCVLIVGSTPLDRHLSDTWPTHGGHMAVCHMADSCLPHCYYYYYYFYCDYYYYYHYYFYYYFYCYY